MSSTALPRSPSARSGVGLRVQKPSNRSGGPAADVGAIVVVGSDVLEAVGGDLMSLDVQHRGEEEDLLHAAGVHALQDALGALPLHAGQVRVAVQDLVNVVDDFSLAPVSAVLAHEVILPSSARADACLLLAWSRSLPVRPLPYGREAIPYVPRG